MDPFTILTLLSVGIGLVGSAASAEAQGREGAQNAAELERSARQAEAARLDALRRGQVAAARKRMEVGEVRGAQTVAFAAGGIDGTTGTALQVADATERVGELDALTIRANAVREAFGHQETARGLAMKAQNTRENTSVNIFNTLAGGAAGAARGAAPLFKKG